MRKQLKASIGQCSGAGLKPLNQDFHGALVPGEPLLSSKGIALALADGISSSQVSQVASEAAVSGFLQDYYCTSETWSVKNSGFRVLKAMNSWLYAQTQSSPFRYDRDKGYICTFSALVIKSNTAHLFHAGDTRIYRFDGDALEQLTTDHQHVVSCDTRYLTKALGINDHLELEYRSVPVSEGDVFLLTTDGIHDVLDAGTLRERVRSHRKDPQALSSLLLEEALARGSQDNLTAQVLRIDQLPERSLKEVNQQLSWLPVGPSLRPRMKFDGYRIIREIYVSSRSHVFLAEDSESGELLVIKAPSTEMKNNEAYLESFLTEDWIARKLDNVHVLKAVVPKRQRRYLYTLTEYINGQTLQRWMDDHPEPSLDAVRNIIIQIAKGLQAFHRQEMVHQDLRPANVMIDELGTVKIIDFGSTRIAGLADIRAINEGIVGTAQYSAPEYFLGAGGTVHSDIFSLGVIAYQMLSGELPYGNAVSRIRNRRDLNRLHYQPLAHCRRGIPAWVDFAICKAVEGNLHKRYSELSEFVHDLSQPNRKFVSRTRPPLAERNPVLFWQGVSAILACLLIWQLATAG